MTQEFEGQNDEQDEPVVGGDTGATPADADAPASSDDTEADDLDDEDLDDEDEDTTGGTDAPAEPEAPAEGGF